MSASNGALEGSRWAEAVEAHPQHVQQYHRRGFLMLLEKGGQRPLRPRPHPGLRPRRNGRRSCGQVGPPLRARAIASCRWRGQRIDIDIRTTRRSPRIALPESHKAPQSLRLDLVCIEVNMALSSNQSDAISVLCDAGHLSEALSSSGMVRVWVKIWVVQNQQPGPQMDRTDGGSGKRSLFAFG